MKNLKMLILYTCLVGLLASCNSGFRVENPAGGSGSKASSSKMDYALVRTEVIEPMCINCHSNANGNSGGVNLESYQSVIQNLTTVEDEVKTDGMPASGPLLTPTEKNIILNWIKEGAPQFVAAASSVPSASTPVPTTLPPDPTATPAPVPSAVLNFSTVYSQVIGPKCVGCHSGYSKYTTVKSEISKIKSNVQSGSMPRNSSLTTQQYNTIINWINAGAPQ
jgi:uncharacterized membrane protein